jgi:hypothetical protein
MNVDGSPQLLWRQKWREILTEQSSYLKKEKKMTNTRTFIPIVTLSDVDTFDMDGMVFLIEGAVELSDGRVVYPEDLQDGDLRALFREATQCRHAEEYFPKPNYTTLFPNVRIIPIKDMMQAYLTNLAFHPNMVLCCGCKKNVHRSVAVADPVWPDLYWTCHDCWNAE